MGSDDKNSRAESASPGRAPRPADDARRRTLKVLIAAGGAAFGCALAVPAAVFVMAPLREDGKGGARWVKTVNLDALTEGEPRKVAIVADQRDAWTVAKNVELGAVWLMRRGNDVVALAAACPHLGCSIHAVIDPAPGFACPCHTSEFDAAGKKISGPSPRDMDPLATKIEDGAVFVDFHRFRNGVAERVRVGV